MTREAYRQLLDATVLHLEGLKDLGVTHVQIRRENLAALQSLPPARPTPPQPPAITSSRPSRPTSPPGPGPIPATPDPPTLPQLPRPSLFTSPPLSLEDRIAALAALQARALACTRCPALAASRRNVVFGTGNPQARILFVGEAPGADEDQLGQPFVGAAGELLSRILTAMDLSRDQVYIANVLKCRPDTPGQLSGNRKPTPAEMGTCLPYLQDQIEIIRPSVLVALGGSAIEGLLGKSPGYVTQTRGKWFDFHGIPIMPTFHPAYLLRTQSALDKRRVWEDMLAVMERLGLPISPRQRAFFSKAS
jgi:DNA polymerase